MSAFPNRPEGSGRGTQFFQWVWDKLACELRFADSTDIKWQRTTGGLSAILANRPGPQSSNHRIINTGLYDPTRQYQTDQFTIYAVGGGQAGVYWCVVTPPIGTAPDTGAPYWMKEPEDSLGVWG